MHIIALLVSVLVSSNHHHGHSHVRAAHRNHARYTATVVPSNRDFLFHNDPQYRNVRQWCEQNTLRCVRVGNSYIVNGQ